jgi:nanoRNase/pAp phosphatase (c-di-AMP/oligoRNAs hydrolase)
MAELIRAGVNRPKLEEKRRELSKMPVEIFSYKATLINRTEFSGDNKTAIVVVPQSEINSFSPLYNPVALIQGDILMVNGVEVAIVLKHYDNGRITGAIRTNPSSPIATSLAEHFGGGGHQYASGFKIENGGDITTIKNDCLKVASELLGSLEKN